MKKLIFLFVISLCSLAVWAYDFSAVAPTGQTLYYTITSDSTVEVSGDTTLTGALTIPNAVVNGSTTYSVTSIGDSAFFQCSGLTSVIIPNLVANIGYRAFLGCSGITTIDIPNSVTSIGASAFCWCSSLTNAVIPNTVTSISGSTFYGCSSLTSVTIPNSVTSIGEAAFYDCISLTSVTIPNSVISIRDFVFRGCSSLTCITIPNSVTSIGQAAFALCTSLISVTIPNSVTTIGDHVFQYCTNLSSVTIGNSVTSIEAGAFAACTSLTSITIPNSVISIGDWAFSTCSSLTAVTIPHSVTSIGKAAFEYCRSLTSMTIPNSVTNIGNMVFSGCNGLTSLIVEDGNTVYDSRENCNAIIETASNTMIAGTKNTFFPISVTAIGTYVFEECFITSMTIPNSVERIGDGAFYNCSSLTSITIGSGVTTVQEEAFLGCDHLVAIICNAVEPPTVTGTLVFEGVWKGLPLIVPGESVGQYQSAYGWRDFTNIIGAPVGIEEESFDYKVYANNGCIAVSGAEGQTLRIYDVQGRLIVSEKAEDNKLYAVPTTGMYMVQVGKNRALKVAVMR